MEMTCTEGRRKIKSKKKMISISFKSKRINLLVNLFITF